MWLVLINSTNLQMNAIPSQERFTAHSVTVENDNEIEGVEMESDDDIDVEGDEDENEGFGEVD